MAVPPLPPSDHIAALRHTLREDRARLAQDYQQHGKAARLLADHSALVDRHLQTLWSSCSLPNAAALIAVGGYGRAELYPRSDIDLLILLQHEPDEIMAHQLQSLVGTLWDIGLEVGHSIRTIEQCLSESSDITVQTNLLEARHIAGNPDLFLKLQEETSAQRDPHAFYLSKLEEQRKRHARYAESDDNLEPNLKESPGGLRDLQTIGWIARAARLGNTWSGLAWAGLITTQEARQIARHDTLLQNLRIRLHYLSKRHEDRLLFDYQALLAEQMGIHPSANRRASEHLMQRYYRTRIFVRQLNSILLQKLGEHLSPQHPAQHALNARFRIVGNVLDLRDEHLFEQQPKAIFEAILLLQQHPELSDFSANTLRALWRARRFIDAAFRRNPINQQQFMQILRQPSGVVHALRRMNQYGILGTYIPAFGRIAGQMQHDLFHIYTVDEHTMMVIRNLRRFTLDKHAHEVPLCSSLMSTFARPEVLYVAGLFHDIAKGRGGDHSQLGKRDARLFCKHHGLDSGDSDLIEWLVENHLALSSTAQKQDLSDPEVIAAFAARIRNDRYLVALYLLTVADVRGTSPRIWNAWKAKLLEDLFQNTRRYLSDGSISNRLNQIRSEAETTLNLYALPADTYRMLWAQLDDSYFLDHEAQEVAWHTRLLAFKANAPEPIVKARLSRAGAGLQVMVYCLDQKRLFARICTFFARMNYTIAEAKIHTTRHGYALNSFQVMEAAPSDANYRDIMNYIEFELAQQIAGGQAFTPPNSGRINRQLRHFPIRTEAQLRPDKQGLHILTLITGDRPGLLARIALLLDRHGLQIHRAKIDTLGSRAEDVFWVSGPLLTQADALSQLTAGLERE